MKVIVAGGTGFIGRHVVERLVARGHDVVVLAKHVRKATDHVTVLACDATCDAFPIGQLAHASAIVNLVGIKLEHANNTFEAAHVRAVARLLELARTLAVDRFVHVSAAGPTSGTHAYRASKLHGQQLVSASGLAFTVLRPGLVYGRGDDMLTQLHRMLHLSPLFPILSAANRLQPIAVEDVAEAIVRTLERDVTIGATIDVVGPEQMSLREIVQRVARALDLWIVTVPLPLALHRLAATVMEKVLREPPVSRTQVELLREGLYGDVQPALRLLGLSPTVLDTDTIVRHLGSASPTWSSRIVGGIEHRTWLARHADQVGKALVVAGVLSCAYLLAGLLLPNPWIRHALLSLLGVPLALTCVRMDWRSLLQPNARNVTVGAMAAMMLLLVFFALEAAMRRWWPELYAQTQIIYGWTHLAPVTAWPVVLVLVAAAEELVWRAAVTLPLVGRFGPTRGIFAGALLFALAHVTTEPPLLAIAALLLGTCLGILLVHSRSLMVPLIAHVSWDLVVLLVRSRELPELP